MKGLGLIGVKVQKNNLFDPHLSFYSFPMPESNARRTLRS